MSYKATDKPSALNFQHIDDDTCLFSDLTHGRDLLPSYVKDKLTWRGMRFLDGVRIKRYGRGNREIKPSYRVNLTRGLR
jgi:hypothetical protein